MTYYVEIVLSSDNVVQIYRRRQHAADTKWEDATGQSSGGTRSVGSFKLDSPFLSPQRACEYLSQRTDNHGPACDHDTLGIRRVASERLARRIVLRGRQADRQPLNANLVVEARSSTDLLPRELCGGENEASSLLCNVPHR